MIYRIFYISGRNEKGQLGVGDTENRSGLMPLDTMSEFTVVSSAVGRNHTLLLTDRGSVFACGDNKSGQCGTGSTNAIIHTPCRISFKEGKVTKVVCTVDIPLWHILVYRHCRKFLCQCEACSESLKHYLYGGKTTFEEQINPFEV